MSVVVVLISRIIVYSLIIAIMQKYEYIANFWLKNTPATTTTAAQPSDSEASFETSNQILEDAVCATLYMKGLMMIQALLESIFLIVVLVIVNKVKNYVKLQLIRSDTLFSQMWNYYIKYSYYPHFYLATYKI